MTMHSLCANYGRFWYFFSCGCISLNDAAAYFVGKSFGRHKLIKLSPNKTWEGFLGGFVLTQVFVVYWTRIML